MKEDRETRERILNVAGRLFVAHGFRKVTVRDICREARANVAAVNYHFGDKLGLYRELMQSAVDAMRRTTDEARAAGEGRPPDEKLRRLVEIFLRRLLTPGAGTVHWLIHRELNEPTPELDTALDMLIEQGVRPRVEYLKGVIAEMIGCDASDRRVLRCVASIQSQAIAYVHSHPVAARLGFAFEPTPANIREAARHVSDFSIAGVRAVGKSKRR
jgi:AcrR family transcriptional regulator